MGYRGPVLTDFLVEQVISEPRDDSKSTHRFSEGGLNLPHHWILVNKLQTKF